MDLTIQNPETPIGTWQSTPSTMLDLASGYRALGWSIIPMCMGQKRPRIKWKCYQETPPSREDVVQWWTQWPEDGIALVLGPVSGVVAVDVDSPEAERIFFDLLRGEPKTRKTLSGAKKPGKAHYLFRCPTFPTTARYTPLHKQLEFRGHGGYVVLPPSLHPSGNRYEWADPKVEIAELPAALAGVWHANPRFQERGRTAHRESNVVADQQSHPVARSDVSRSLLSLLRLIDLAPSTRDWLLGRYAHADNWNHRLFVAACDLAGHQVRIETAEPFLLRGAQPDTPADDQAARRTIQSAFSQPRQPLSHIVGAYTPTDAQPEQVAVGGNSVRIIRLGRLSQPLRVGD